MLPFFLDKDIGIVVSKEPKNTFYEIYYTIYSEGKLNYSENKISDSATISPKATIASSGVVIGDNCVIGDNAVIREGTILGNNVHIETIVFWVAMVMKLRKFMGLVKLFLIRDFVF